MNRLYFYTLSPNFVDNSIGLKYLISSGLKNIKRITALRLFILTGYPVNTILLSIT